MRVNFFIGGTEKGGTTALYNMLKHHPCILLPRSKELHYFSDDRYFDGSGNSYDVYHALYKSRSFFERIKVNFNIFLKDPVIGEATPDYMWWESAPERIFRYNHAAKWILLLRNPVDRAISHYKMEVFKKKRERMSFRDALIHEAERLNACHFSQDRIFSYTSRGFYTDQIRRIYSHFPKENVHIELSENFRNNPQSCLDNICKFLDIGRYKESYLPAKIDANVNISDINISDINISYEDRCYLTDFYRNEVNSLKELLNQDLSEWVS